VPFEVFIASLNVTVKAVVACETSVPLGETVNTVGAVMSGSVAVVKVIAGEGAVKAFPAASVKLAKVIV
jgi:hypothetical protein